MLFDEEATALEGVKKVRDDDEGEANVGRENLRGRNEP